MKYTIITIAFTLILLNCKAQSPILPLDDLGWRNTDNAYYKDIENELNSFEGTWLYSNGNTSLKIALVKSTMYFNGDYYEDMIVGGYQYIENGVEKVNCLSDVNNLNLGYDAEIWGNTIFEDCNYMPVDDCTDGEKRLGISIDDPHSQCHIGDLILHKRTVNGQDALKIRIEMNYYCDDPIDGNFPPPSIPWQMHNIVLIKQ